MRVDIYIDTEIKGPSIRDSKWKSTLCCGYRGKQYQKVVEGREENTTFHRCTLIAVLESLKALKPGQEILIHTYDRFTAGQMESGSPQSWRRQEWKTAKGKEVKNKELWQQVLEELEKQKSVNFIEWSKNEQSEHI